MSNIVPYDKTTFIPITYPLKGPFLIKYFPAALVDKFPPI